MGNACVALLRRFGGRACLVALAVLICVGDASAGIYAVPADRAAAWLETQQDSSDGSWRNPSAARTFLQTAEAVLALHQINRRRNAYYAGQTWIENHAPSNIDLHSRRLQVLRVTQSSTAPDINALFAADVFNPATGQTGWGLTGNYRPEPLDTALVLDALNNAGYSISSMPIPNIIRYLKATQLTGTGNQGWAAAGGTTSDPYVTARVVDALSSYKLQDSTLVTPLANAVATLRAKVSTSSATHLRAAAALAYLRLDLSSSDARTLLNSLMVMQRADGGFDAGIFATALIVQAFAAAEFADLAPKRLRVDMPDAALRQAINAILGRRALDALNRGELAELTSLNIAGRGITNLQGLQYAINLTTLDASNNLITDTSPIAALPKLTTVNLAGNPCAGCSVLAASDADVPFLPAWALVTLGVGLMAAAQRAGRRVGPSS